MGNPLIVSNATKLRSVYNDLNKLQNSIVNLYWSVFSTNQGFNDIFTDQFDTQDGIDQTYSNYIFDSTNKCLIKPSLTNLVLVTKTWECSQINPNRAFTVIEIETVDEIQLGVDVTIKMSTDSGLHYTELTPLEIYQTVDISDYNKLYFIRGDISTLPQLDNNQIKTMVTCSLTKNIKLHGVASGVSY